MRTLPLIAITAALGAWLVVSHAGAEDAPFDAAKEARLSAADGKFRESDGIIERAPPEVQNDPALRLQLGETAIRYAHTKQGEAKREALDSAVHHFCKVVELKPDEARGALGALQAAKELAELEVAARNFDEARKDAKAAIDAAEKALAAGVSSPEFKLALGRTYGFHASFLKSMKDVEVLASDSSKAAKLLEDAAAAMPDDAGTLLSEGSSYQLRAANLIHEGIPVDTEKRDDDALASAIELATKACNLKGASENDFGAHLSALRLAHNWGMKLDQKPFMSPLGPPLPGLKLEIPRAGGWTSSKAAGWTAIVERNLHDPKNDGTVQVCFKEWATSETTLGKSWGQLNDIAPRRFEKFTGDEFKEVTSKKAPALLAGPKGTPEVWYYEVAGSVSAQDPKSPDRTRGQKRGEFLWIGDAKKEFAWQMMILDFRPAPDLEEPDIIAFVASAIGEGRWPPGAKGKDEGKKDPNKKPPPKKK